MKTIPGLLATHIGSEVTALATLWRVTRTDGAQHFFTDADRDVSVDVDVTGGPNPKLYKAASGYNRTAVQNTSTLSVDNLDVRSHLDPDFAQITEADVQSGKMDFAQVEVFLVNYLRPQDGVAKLRKGFLGEVNLEDEVYQAELRGLVQLLAQTIGENYTVQCRADLGDDRCKVPTYPRLLGRNQVAAVGEFYRVDTVDPGDGTAFDHEDRMYEVTTAGITAATQPVYDTTPGNTTADGTAVLTARFSWFRAFEVLTVLDNRRFVVTELTPNSGHTVQDRVPQTVGFPDDWFNGGLCHFQTGNNAGLTEEVDDFVADDGVTIEQEVRLFVPMPFEVQVGNRGFVTPGCDKALFTCRDKFDNVDNFRGEPYVPGNDALLRGPSLD